MQPDTKSNYLVYAQFNDGYSLRNLGEFLKMTNTQGNLVFQANGIFYTQSDGRNTICNDLDIDVSNLTSYVYNAPEPQIIFGVTLGELKLLLQPIEKRDSVALYILDSDPYLYVKPSSAKSKALAQESMARLKPQRMDYIKIDPPEFEMDETTPTCTVPIADFCKACRSYGRFKGKVAVRGFPRGVTLEAEGPITDLFHKFGFPNEPDNEDRGHFANCSWMSKIDSMSPSQLSLPAGPAPRLVIRHNVRDSINTIVIDASIMKALVKLNNVSSANGTIKFYIERGNPIMKLICNVGSYGRLTIYLMNTNPE